MNHKMIETIKHHKQFFVFSMMTAGCIALSLYFWFLQLPYGISLRYLGLTVVLWVVLWAVLFGLYLFLHPKNKAPTSNMVEPALLMSFVVAIVVLLVFIPIVGTAELPYNHLLLPKHTLEIVVDEDQPTGQVIGLIYLHSGLHEVSFSQLEQSGDWQQTESGLVATSGAPASILYTGWLVDKASVVLQSHPNGGAGKIFWDGQPVNFDLQSDSGEEFILSYAFTTNPLNKLSVLLITLLACTGVIFLLLFLLIFSRNESLIGAFSIDAWFEETSLSLRRLVLLLLASSVVLSGLLFLYPFKRDQNSLGGAFNTTKALPNVILIVVDSLTAEDMSIFGYGLPTTPMLEQMTQDWTVYSNAHTSSTCTISLMATLLTGRQPYFSYPYTRFGEKVLEDEKWVDISDLLDEAGYEIWWNGYLTPGFYHLGEDFSQSVPSPITMPLLSRPFQIQGVRSIRFPHVPLSLQLANAFEKFRADHFTLAEYAKTIEQGKPQAPFFLYIHYEGAHGVPYEGGKYLGTFLPLEEGLYGRVGQETITGKYSPEQQRYADMLRLRYDEGIRLQDENLVEFVDNLKRAGLYDASLIIILSDHGQVFKKGYTTHCTPLLSNEETHIPILVKYPYQTKGKKVEQLVSHIDIAPTILDALGIPYSSEWFDGVSLMGLEAESKERILLVRNTLQPGPNAAAINESYRLVFSEGEYYLYQYREDPGEKFNLLEGALTGEEQAVYLELRNALDGYLAQMR